MRNTGLDVGDALSQGVNLAHFPDSARWRKSRIHVLRGAWLRVETGGVQNQRRSRRRGRTSTAGVLATGRTSHAERPADRRAAEFAGGLRHPDLVNQVWSINPNVGGPIVKDRLWFFAAHSTQRAYIFPAGSSWTANPQGVPGQGLQRPGEGHVHRPRAVSQLDLAGHAQGQGEVVLDRRLGPTRTCYLQGKTLGSIFVAPEAAIKSAIDTNTYQVSWSRPQTSRLLLEAGFSHEPVEWSFLPADRAVS